MKQRSVEGVYAELSTRIIKIRDQRGMSQERLASESGIDRSHLGFIEQGRRRPTITTLFKIAKALDISLEQFFKDL